MEKEKYYTPRATEFYIGFEYEEFCVEWLNGLFEFYDTFEDLEDKLFKGLIRVKCLNEDDIKSFGFKINETIHFRDERMMFNGQHKVYQLEENHLIYFIENLHGMTKDINKVIVSIYNKETMGINDRPACLFNGDIKNKSELASVLEMIGVFKHKKRKKMKNKEKGWILGYDVKSLPDCKTMIEVQRDAETKGVVMWDSSKNGYEPQIINLGGDKNEYLKDCKIVDLFNTESE